jgi:hypothetical protein
LSVSSNAAWLPFFFGFHKSGLEAIQATKQIEPALWKVHWALSQATKHTLSDDKKLMTNHHQKLVSFKKLKCSSQIKKLL